MNSNDYIRIFSMFERQRARMRIKGSEFMDTTRPCVRLPSYYEELYMEPIYLESTFVSRLRLTVGLS